MTKTFEFDRFKGERNINASHCAACEAMLADALDGLLVETDQAWFDGHVRSCAECSEMLGDAQRGAAWLEMLRMPRPEPSARLMERILAQTSGSATALLAEVTVQQPQMVPVATPIVMPGVVPVNVLAFPPRRFRIAGWSRAMLEPRLAMTAAMAFFSVALTLNLTGVQLNRLHVSVLKPANLKHSYYAANAEAARYYDNLRVVQVVQSRVQDLRAASADVLGGGDDKVEPEDTPEDKRHAPETKPEDKKREDGHGMSRREAPGVRRPVVTTDMRIGQTGEPFDDLKKMRAEGDPA